MVVEEFMQHLQKSPNSSPFAHSGAPQPLSAGDQVGSRKEGMGENVSDRIRPRAHRAFQGGSDPPPHPHPSLEPYRPFQDQVPPRQDRPRKNSRSGEPDLCWSQNGHLSALKQEDPAPGRLNSVATGEVPPPTVFCSKDASVPLEFPEKPRKRDRPYSGIPPRTPEPVSSQNVGVGHPPEPKAPSVIPQGAGRGSKDEVSMPELDGMLSESGERVGRGKGRSQLLGQQDI